MTDDRAVSSVIGVVMILAITIAAITSVMVIGAYALSQSQTDAELSRMETSMAQMSSKASLTALGDAGTQHFDVGNLREGSLEVKEAAGSLRLEVVDQNNESDLLYETDSFGALVYTVGQHEVAYQGGGVWRKSGDDGGSMISPPEYHYRSETLTFPIIRISGDSNSGHDGSGSVTHTSYDSIFPTSQYENPVDNATVFIEIESDYHQGWYDFFTSRSDGEIQHDSENSTVRAELTAIYESEFLGALAVQDSYDVHHNSEADDVVEGTIYPSASETIDDRIADCSTVDFDDGVTDYDGEATYCGPDQIVEFDQDLSFDTSEGDVNVILPGGMDLNGNDISIDGAGTVNIYSKGPVYFGNADVNPTGESGQLFIYFHSDVDHLEESGNFHMNGVIYAPNTAIEFSGNVQVHGSVIAKELESNGAAASYTFDEELLDELFTIDQAHDVLRYLHVTENVVEILLN